MEHFQKERQTLFFEIIKMYIKSAKKRFPQIKDFEEILFKLGKLSWEALQKKTKQLLISKVSKIRYFHLIYF